MYGSEIWPVNSSDVALYTIDLVSVVLMARATENVRAPIFFLVTTAILRTMAAAFITYAGHGVNMTMIYIVLDKMLFQSILGLSCFRIARAHKTLAFMMGIAYIQFYSYYTWHEPLTDTLRLADDAVAVLYLLVMGCLEGSIGYVNVGMLSLIHI